MGIIWLICIALLMVAIFLADALGGIIMQPFQSEPGRRAKTVPEHGRLSASSCGRGWLAALRVFTRRVCC